MGKGTISFLKSNDLFIDKKLDRIIIPLEVTKTIIDTSEYSIIIS